MVILVIGRRLKSMDGIDNFGCGEADWREKEERKLLGEGNASSRGVGTQPVAGPGWSCRISAAGPARAVAVAEWAATSSTVVRSQPQRAGGFQWADNSSGHSCT